MKAAVGQAVARPHRSALTAHGHRGACLTWL